MIKQVIKDLTPYYQTEYGALFQEDCVKILPSFSKESFDTIFLDPPFNLNKDYGNYVNDQLSENNYYAWMKDVLFMCVKLLKPGGAFFLYNIPKHNIYFGNYLMTLLSFRHWIAIDLPHGFAGAKSLHPSHYSLLYYTKGQPKTFHRIRTPLQKCRHCDGLIKDYGGHLSKMNEQGVTLKDVWADINPVRHKKYKDKQRTANALSTKMLDRVIEMATNPGDLVLDPFMGSGTTAAVCEAKKRHWLGIDISSGDIIIKRLQDKHIQHHANDDFVDK